MNDLLDLKADRQDLSLSTSRPDSWQPEVTHLDITTLRHPVAAGALPVWAAATWVGVLGAIGLAAAYLLRPLCAWLFIGCAVLQVLYCSLRRRTWLKVVPAATLVAMGGLAGWFAVGEATWGALAFFFLLFGWEVSRNLSNDLADVSHDRRVGITTLAAVHGPATSMRSIVVVAAIMPLIGAAQPGSWIPRVLARRRGAAHHDAAGRLPGQAGRHRARRSAVLQPRELVPPGRRVRVNHMGPVLRPI